MHAERRFVYELFKVAVVAGIAAAITAVTYLVVHLTAGPETYLHQLFYDRSWIQHANTWLFWFVMATLAMKQVNLRREESAFAAAERILTDPQIQSPMIWSDAQFLLKQLAPDPMAGHSIVFSRLVRALERLHKTKSTKAMEDYLQMRSDSDAAEMETSYAGIRYGMWLIPTMGFLGTVLGVGQGIANFADVIQTATDFEAVKAELPMVTNLLGTAFDTTLLALAFSAVAMYAVSRSVSQQERLLERIDTLCFDGMCALFQEHSTTADEVARALRDEMVKLGGQMAGNRGSVEQVLRTELPILLAQELSRAFDAMNEPLRKLLGQVANSAMATTSAQAQANTELAKIRELMQRGLDDRAQADETNPRGNR
jgi:hypothetical protein